MSDKPNAKQLWIPLSEVLVWCYSDNEDGIYLSAYRHPDGTGPRGEKVEVVHGDSLKQIPIDAEVLRVELDAIRIATLMEALSAAMLRIAADTNEQQQ